MYALGTAAALRLLPRGGRKRRFALLALVAVGGLCVMTGWYLLWPLVLTVGAVAYVRVSYRKPARVDSTS